MKSTIEHDSRCQPASECQRVCARRSRGISRGDRRENDLAQRNAEFAEKNVAATFFLCGLSAPLREIRFSAASAISA
jgi:hypothetical protein